MLPQFVSSCFDSTVCVWEHSLPDSNEHGLKGMQLNMCSSEQCVKHTLLMEVEGSMRCVLMLPVSYIYIVHEGGPYDVPYILWVDAGGGDAKACLPSTTQLSPIYYLGAV